MKTMAIPWYVYECCSAEGHSTRCPLPLPMDGKRQALDILGCSCNHSAPSGYDSVLCCYTAVQSHSLIDNLT